jgi:hypothetical protein
MKKKTLVGYTHLSSEKKKKWLKKQDKTNKERGYEKNKKEEIENDKTN